MITKIIIIGAAGRMGSRITELALQDKEIKIVGLIEHSKHTLLGKHIFEQTPVLSDKLEYVIEMSDVIIDFSFPETLEKNFEVIKKNKKSIVIGTTGHTNSQIENIKLLSKDVPVILSPNMSIGVNTLFKAVDYVIKILAQKGYDIEIIESHHNKKKDSPSGTAKKVMDIIKTNIPQTEFVFGREGLIGERKKNEVGVFAIRAGDIVGEHTILFSANGEKLELKHTAISRDTFAKGAILAAKWLNGKNAGLYSMYDVLGI